MRSLRHSRNALRRRGSALLPLIAAMLIMVLSGVALSETFGSQRRESVLDVEATRAYWIAEAGLWHAAYEEAAITTAVPFGGGSYLVTRDGSTYSSFANQGEGAALVALQMEEEAEGPLDITASIATIDRHSDKKFTLDLVSIWPEDIVITSFELSDDAEHDYEAHRFKLEKKDIWHEHHGIDMPTGLVDLNKGTTSQRTVESLDSPTLLFQAHEKPSYPVTYTLILHFSYGGQSTLIFSVPWEEDEDDDDDDDD